MYMILYSVLPELLGGETEDEGSAGGSPGIVTAKCLQVIQL